MATTKEQLSANCDKIAYGIAGLIVIILFVVMNSHDDPERSGQGTKDIIQDITDIVMVQKYTMPPPPDVMQQIQSNWYANSFPADSYQPYGFYCQPAVVRIFQQQRIDRARHLKPKWQEIAMVRDKARNKVVIKLTFDLGAMENVEVKRLEIQRKSSDDASWKPLPANDALKNMAAQVEGVKGVTYIDENVEPEKSYQYRIESQVSTDREWENDLDQSIQVSDAALPADQLAAFQVPADVQLSLFQCQQGGINQAGHAYFKVRYYDYEKGKIVDNPPTKFDEHPRGTDLADADIIPHTEFYLMYVGKREAILKHRSRPGVTLEVKLGKWYPESITLPKPWTPGGGEEPASTEPAAPGDVMPPPPGEPAPPPLPEPAGADTGKEPGEAPPPLPPPRRPPPEKPKEEQDTGGIR